MQFLDMLADCLEDAPPPLVRMGSDEFARRVLGVRLWAGQRRINDAVAAGHRRVYVGTGHGIGKTFDCAHLVCWALATWDPPPVVITSAPTFRQVRDQLWREVRQMWNGSERLAHLAECMTTKVELDETHYAYGFSTNEPARFQGIHAPRLLFVIDEANGFPDKIKEAIDACMTGGGAQLVAIGNCVVPYGWFFRGFGDPSVRTMRISSRRHPNVRAGRELIRGAVTRGWIEEFEAEYASRPEIVASRVDAVFPSSASHGLIDREWLDAARSVEARTRWPVVLSVDVARYGDNLTVMTRQEGQLMARAWEWSKCGIDETARRVAREAREHGADYVVVDDDGVGGGVTDILRSDGMPVVAFHNGGRADRPEVFTSQATEAYWAVRSHLEGRVLAADVSDGLSLQLTTREYEMRPSGQIKLESKDEYRRRTGLGSPDRADSWAMGVWQVDRAWRRSAA